MEDQVDLHLVIDPAAPRRVQLERQLRTAIRDGRLRPGTRLPPTRALAEEIGVSRGVAVEAYEQLVAEGWLVARTGAGTRVAEAAPGRSLGAAAGPRVPTGALSARGDHLGDGGAARGASG